MLQGGGARVSQKEERICQVFGESRRCAGKPEQDSHRGAQSSQRHLLSQARISLTNTAQGLCDPQTTPLFCRFAWILSFLFSQMFL